ncbi:hypothetical protein evm_013429 [Chilo suppressalis]|nr:hypothetical protein evm_013429 [Chilo suppressalis]
MQYILKCTSTIVRLYPWLYATRRSVISQYADSALRGWTCIILDACVPSDSPRASIVNWLNILRSLSLIVDSFTMGRKTPYYHCVKKRKRKNDAAIKKACEARWKRKTNPAENISVAENTGTIPSINSVNSTVTETEKYPVEFIEVKIEAEETSKA